MNQWSGLFVRPFIGDDPELGVDWLLALFSGPCWIFFFLIFYVDANDWMVGTSAGQSLHSDRWLDVKVAIWDSRIHDFLFYSFIYLFFCFGVKVEPMNEVDAMNRNYASSDPQNLSCEMYSGD